MAAGLIPRAALALAGAGFHSLADLEGATREKFLAIKGVGVSSLEAIDRLLGQPLPGNPAPYQGPPPFPDFVWRQRGVPTEAAITFAQMGMTVDRLKSMTREELFSLRGVGIGAVQACELIIGRAIPSRRSTDPVEAYWRDQGILPRAARVLRQAGIRSPEDLRWFSREDLFAIQGLGAGTLARLEALLGSEIRSRADDWRSRGLSAAVANVLVREGIHTLEDLGRLTREQLFSFRGIGYFALRACERLLGRRLPSTGSGSSGRRERGNPR